MKPSRVTVRCTLSTIEPPSATTSCKQPPPLKDPSQPPPFSMPSKLLMLHGEVKSYKSYYLTKSCVPESMFHYLQ